MFQLLDYKLQIKLLRRIFGSARKAKKKLKK